MDVRRHALRLRQPLQSAYGTVAERELLAVSLTGEDGITGYGEAAPLEPYDSAAAVPVGTVARLVGASERVDLRRVVGEHRLSPPALHEVLDRPLLDLLRQAMVALAPLAPLKWIVDAGGGGDQHEPSDPLGSDESDVQCDPAAHRVAGEREAIRTAMQHALDTSLERDRPWSVSLLAMPREVKRHGAIAFLRQCGDHALEGVARAAKAMQHHNALTHAAILRAKPVQSVPIGAPTHRS